MNELAGVLRRHRHLLEKVVYKATVVRRLVDVDDRYLAWAADELAHATDELRVAEIERSVATHRAAADAGIRDRSPTLAELAQVAPEPYRTMLEDHGIAMRALLADLDELSDECRTYAIHGRRQARLALAELDGRRNVAEVDR